MQAVNLRAILIRTSRLFLCLIFLFKTITALSTRLIERIFSGAVTRGGVKSGGTQQPEDKMSYTEFVWFLLSEEDKNHPTAIEYWFRYEYPLNDQSTQN